MSDIDFLLDSEKEQIQKELSEKYTDNGKEEKNEPDHITDPNKKKKAELIEDFMKMQAEAGREDYTEKNLKRMTKPEIIKLIANFMNTEIMEKASETEKKIIEGEDGKPEIIEVPKNELSSEKLQLVAEGIFAINFALCSVMETASTQFKSKTWDIPLLEKWTEKVSGKKKELIIIFTQMYIDYKAEFDKYLSPVVQWSIIMMQTGAQTVLENVKKKKSEENNK